MYGLMRSRSCSQTREQKTRRRLHYCGTCKTMGRLYGQRARLLLNNDAVFLGEVLSALSMEDRGLDSWDYSYRSYNCLSLPDAPDQMPLALQVAATATVVMTEFKVADQIADSAGRRWRAAQSLFSESFREASRLFEDWNFPVAELWQWFDIQSEREKEVSRPAAVVNPSKVVEYLAEPTATVTGLVFENNGSDKIKQRWRRNS